MARDFSKNLSNYMSLGINALNPLLNGASALSVHCWANIDSTDTATNDNRITQIFLSPGTGLLFCIDNTTASRLVRVAGRSVDTDALQARNGTTDLALNTWHSLGGVMNFTGDTITPYVNGAAENGGAATFGNNTWTPGVPTTPDMIGANNTPPGTTPVQFDGRLAEFAIWAGDIGTAGFAALAKGYSALMVKPELLAVYAPLVGNYSPEIDLISGVQGTITGTIAKADHPRIIYPTAAQILRFAANAAVASNSRFFPFLPNRH